MVTCAVRDEILFGLQVGDELKIDTTICHEIRQSGKDVVIDHVDNDEFYRHHHTPEMYKFQSYISYPIWRQDGTLFGTLCAIDPTPAILNTIEIRTMFRLYVELISLHMHFSQQLGEEEIVTLEYKSIQVLSSQAAEISDTITDVANSVRGNKSVLQKILESSHAIQRLVDDLKTNVESSTAA